ncbi:helix-turn-helix domain-containing protein [Siminovitchia fortis]|uniref:helix-turn-helix domain-containing protein n=1 Tax=Siminovitchia fortis TaxID=254758 RepID=UPI001642EC51|nr:ImmA/IrrE family metallo-endopeptidase [Siminovitchia fortis]
MNDLNISKVIGDNINKIKEQLGLSNEQLGQVLGVTRQTVSNYLKGEQTIDSAKLFKLSRLANVPLTYFMETDNNMEFSFMFRADNPQENADVKLINFLTNKLNSYWDILTLAEENKVIYLPEEYHLDLKKNSLDEHHKEAIKEVAQKFRKSLGIEEDLKADIYSVLERNNIHVYSFQYETLNVDALSVFDKAKGSFILLNNHPNIPEERKIFSVVHELGHLIFHRDQYSKGTANLTYTNYKNDINEKVANTFASYFLIPRPILKNGAYDYYFKGNRFFSLNDLINLKKEFGVSAQAMLVALLEEKFISGQIFGFLNKQLKDRGFEKAEPYPMEPLEKNQKLKFILKDLFLKEEITVNKVAEVLNLNTRSARNLTKEWAEFGYPED